MTPAVRGALIVAVLCVAAALVYWFGFREKPAPPPAPAAAPQAPASSPPERPGLATTPSGPPLPTLSGSDGPLLEVLSQLFGADIEKLVLRPGIVHRIVATIDNLPRAKVPQQVMPVKPVGGPFGAIERAARLSISPDNADRYARYMGRVSRLDTAQLVGTYRHYYPLFQQAYRELGYPKGEFNDRLIEVIDDLLEAPQPEPPVALVAPRAMFEYADAALQDASAGQKIMIRIGPENEARVKAKLRQIRRALDGVDLPR